MIVRLTQDNDLNRVMEIYSIARQYMKDTGNPNHWKDFWPPEDLIKEEIKNKISYVIEENNHIYGVFAFFVGHDSTYDLIVDGDWIDRDSEYGVIHRIASSQERKGIMDETIKYVESIINNVKVDTHFDNIVMQKALERNGFQRCGIISTHDGSESISYQKITKKK